MKNSLPEPYEIHMFLPPSSYKCKNKIREFNLYGTWGSLGEKKNTCNFWSCFLLYKMEIALVIICEVIIDFVVWFSYWLLLIKGALVFGKPGVGTQGLAYTRHSSTELHTQPVFFFFFSNWVSFSSKIRVYFKICLEEKGNMVPPDRFQRMWVF